MTVDYAALWVLVVLNSFAILLLIRQLAVHPSFSQRRTGPKIGTPVGDWSLPTVGGSLVQSVDLADAYVLLFVQSTCQPCHALFQELRRVGRPAGVLYVVAQGDAPSIAAEAATEQGPLYDLLFEDARGDLFLRLQIPGTPYALAVRHGHVVAGGLTSNPAQLSKVCEEAAPVQGTDETAA